MMLTQASLHGNTIRMLHDALGRLVAQDDGLGHWTYFAFDQAGRMVLDIAPDGGLTQREYDSAGNLLALTDASGNTTRWVYDGLNRKIKETDPTGESRTWAYDDAGRLASETDRLGRVKEFAYDDAGRLRFEYWKVGGVTVETLEYTWNADGAPASASNSLGTYAFTYDDRNRLLTQTDPWGITLTSTYNQVNDRTGLSDSQGGAWTSTFDDAHRLVSRTLEAGSLAARVELDYDARDERTELRRYSDAAGTTLVGSTTYTQDPGRRLAELLNKDGSGAALVDYDNTYDDGNRITQESRNSAPQTFDYDENSQVTSGYGNNYEYDYTGNRTMSGWTSGAANRLSTDGTWTYSHDAEGNLVKRSMGSSAETWTYGYDHRNQLTWVEKRSTDGGTLLLRVEYLNDVFGNLLRRIETVGSSTTATRYAFEITDRSPGITKSVHRLWGQVDAAETVTLRYLLGEGDTERWARMTSSGVHWLVAGSPGKRPRGVG